MAELIAGTKVKGRYVLKESKGSGSFGEVWLAHDEVLDCDVAVKIYISLDPHGVEEFRSEYTTTLGLSHPNLLTTTYFDVWEQRPFLVMKYCERGSSSALAGSINEYDLWQFIHDVAAGLKYLHGLPEPIIHQDIKPDNILVDNAKRFLITDFGISKKIRSTMRKQSMRAVGAGATAYMGPERFDSDPSPVKASDIWSLGASIYELATGELPFNGLGGVMLKNGAELPGLGNKWSKELTMVMQSCLTKETWDRPTAQQLEIYSAAILTGNTATPGWNPPATPEVLSAAASSPEPKESSASSGFQNELGIRDEHSNSNKKRMWLAIGGIVAAIMVLILVWNPTNADSEPIVIPEDVLEDDSVPGYADSIVPEEVSANDAKTYNAQSVPSGTGATKAKKDESKVTPAESKADNNAALLKNALANGDYGQVQKLANQGYAAAYGPLAKYYLNNHDYSTAESYAKKAKAAGFSEGSSVLKTLENLGYYD